MAVDYTKRRGTPSAQSTTSAPSTPSAQSPAAGAGVNLSKVTLTKSAPAVSLSKQGSGAGLLRVNLNWNARPMTAQPTGGGGFLKRLAGAAAGKGVDASGGIDLDLACLYEYTDGSKGVVQALGNALRDRNSFGSDPIVWLDGDDRSGTNSGGENLFINLARSASIQRILVFTFIYEGAPNWADAAAVVTLFPTSGPQVEMHLDEADPRSRMCAIALLENRGGEIVVNREVKYIQGGQDAVDRAYGWGLRWAAGRK